MNFLRRFLHFLSISEKYKALHHPFLEKVKYLMYTYDGFLKDDERPKYEDYEENVLDAVYHYTSEYSRSGKGWAKYGQDKFAWYEEEYGKEGVVKYKKLQENLFKVKQRNSYFYLTLIGIIILLFSYILLRNNYDRVTEFSSNPVNTATVTKTIKDIIDKNFPTIRNVAATRAIPKEEAVSVLSEITKKPKNKLYDSVKAEKHNQIVEFTSHGTVQSFTQSHIRSAKKDPSLFKIPTESNQNYPIKGLVVNTKDYEIKDEKILKEVLTKYAEPPPTIMDVLNSVPSFVRSEKVIKAYTAQMSPNESLRFEDLVKNVPSKSRTEHDIFTMIDNIAFDATASLKDSYQATYIGLQYSQLIFEHKHTFPFQKEEYFNKIKNYQERQKVLELYGEKNGNYQIEDNPHFKEMFEQAQEIIEHLRKKPKKNPFISETRFLSEKNNEAIELTRSKYTNNEHLPKDLD